MNTANRITRTSNGRAARSWEEEEESRAFLLAPLYGRESRQEVCGGACQENQRPLACMAMLLLVYLCKIITLVATGVGLLLLFPFFIFSYTSVGALAPPPWCPVRRAHAQTHEGVHAHVYLWAAVFLVIDHANSKLTTRWTD